MSAMIVILGIVALFLILPIWAAIDAGGRPGWAFEQAGTTKTLWIVLPIVGIFVCGLVGIVSGIIWFSTTRPKVIAAAANPAGAGSAFGAPVGSWGSESSPPVTPVSPAGMPGAGWYNDPAHRHELRYFDGSVWTEHVSDQGVQGSDLL